MRRSRRRKRGEPTPSASSTATNDPEVQHEEGEGENKANTETELATASKSEEESGQEDPKSETETTNAEEGSATPTIQNKTPAMAAATRRSTRHRRPTPRSVLSTSQNPISSRGKRRRPSNDSSSTTATKDTKSNSKGGDEDHISTGGSGDERDSEEEPSQEPLQSSNKSSSSKSKQQTKQGALKNEKIRKSGDHGSDIGSGGGGDTDDPDNSTHSGDEMHESDDESSPKKKRKKASSTTPRPKKRKQTSQASHSSNNDSKTKESEKHTDGESSNEEGSKANKNASSQENSAAKEDETKAQGEPDTDDSDERGRKKKAPPRRRVRGKKTPQASKSTKKNQKAHKPPEKPEEESSDDDADETSVPPRLPPTRIASTDDDEESSDEEGNKGKGSAQENSAAREIGTNAKAERDTHDEEESGRKKKSSPRRRPRGKKVTQSSKNTKKRQKTQKPPEEPEEESSDDDADDASEPPRAPPTRVTITKGSSSDEEGDKGKGSAQENSADEEDELSFRGKSDTHDEKESGRKKKSSSLRRRVRGEKAAKASKKSTKRRKKIGTPPDGESSDDDADDAAEPPRVPSTRVAITKGASSEEEGDKANASAQENTADEEDELSFKSKSDTHDEKESGRKKKSSSPRRRVRGGKVAQASKKSTKKRKKTETPPDGESSDDDANDTSKTPQIPDTRGASTKGDSSEEEGDNANATAQENTAAEEDELSFKHESDSHDEEKSGRKNKSRRQPRGSAAQARKNTKKRQKAQKTQTPPEGESSDNDTDNASEPPRVPPSGVANTDARVEEEEVENVDSTSNTEDREPKKRSDSAAKRSGIEKPAPDSDTDEDNKGKRSSAPLQRRLRRKRPQKSSKSFEKSHRKKTDLNHKTSDDEEEEAEDDHSTSHGEEDPKTLSDHSHNDESVDEDTEEPEIKVNNAKPKNPPLSSRRRSRRRASPAGSHTSHQTKQRKGEPSDDDASIEKAAEPEDIKEQHDAAATPRDPEENKDESDVEGKAQVVPKDKRQKQQPHSSATNRHRRRRSSIPGNVDNSDKNIEKLEKDNDASDSDDDNGDPATQSGMARSNATSKKALEAKAKENPPCDLKDDKGELSAKELKRAGAREDKIGKRLNPALSTRQGLRRRPSQASNVDTSDKSAEKVEVVNDDGDSDDDKPLGEPSSAAKANTSAAEEESEHEENNEHAEPGDMDDTSKGKPAGKSKRGSNQATVATTRQRLRRRPSNARKSGTGDKSEEQQDKNSDSEDSDSDKVDVKISALLPPTGSMGDSSSEVKEKENPDDDESLQNETESRDDSKNEAGSDDKPGMDAKEDKDGNKKIPAASTRRSLRRRPSQASEVPTKDKNIEKPENDSNRGGVDDTEGSNDEAEDKPGTGANLEMSKKQEMPVGTTKHRLRRRSSQGSSVGRSALGPDEDGEPHELQDDEDASMPRSQEESKDKSYGEDTQIKPARKKGVKEATDAGTDGNTDKSEKDSEEGGSDTGNDDVTSPSRLESSVATEEKASEKRKEELSEDIASHQDTARPSDQDAIKGASDAEKELVSGAKDEKGEEEKDSESDESHQDQVKPEEQEGLKNDPDTESKLDAVGIKEKTGKPLSPTGSTEKPDDAEGGRSIDGNDIESGPFKPGSSASGTDVEKAPGDGLDHADASKRRAVEERKGEFVAEDKHGLHQSNDLNTPPSGAGEALKPKDNTKNQDAADSRDETFNKGEADTEGDRGQGANEDIDSKLKSPSATTKPSSCVGVIDKDSDTLVEDIGGDGADRNEGCALSVVQPTGTPISSSPSEIVEKPEDIHTGVSGSNERENDLHEDPNASSDITEEKPEGKIDKEEIRQIDTKEDVTRKSETLPPPDSELTESQPETGVESGDSDLHKNEKESVNQELNDPAACEDEEALSRRGKGESGTVDPDTKKKSQALDVSATREDSEKVSPEPDEGQLNSQCAAPEAPGHGADEAIPSEKEQGDKVLPGAGLEDVIPERNRGKEAETVNKRDGQGGDQDCEDTGEHGKADVVATKDDQGVKAIDNVGGSVEVEVAPGGGDHEVVDVVNKLGGDGHPGDDSPEAAASVEDSPAGVQANDHLVRGDEARATPAEECLGVEQADDNDAEAKSADVDDTPGVDDPCVKQSPKPEEPCTPAEADKSGPLLQPPKGDDINSELEKPLTDSDTFENSGAQYAREKKLESVSDQQNAFNARGDNGSSEVKPHKETNTHGSTVNSTNPDQTSSKFAGHENADDTRTLKSKEDDSFATPEREGMEIESSEVLGVGRVLPSDDRKTKTAAHESGDREVGLENSQVNREHGVSSPRIIDEVALGAKDPEVKPGKDSTGEETTADGDRAEESTLQPDTHGEEGRGVEIDGDQSQGPSDRASDAQQAGQVGEAPDQSDDDFDQFHDARMELPPSEPSSPVRADLETSRGVKKSPADSFHPGEPPIAYDNQSTNPKLQAEEVSKVEVLKNGEPIILGSALQDDSKEAELELNATGSSGEIEKVKCELRGDDKDMGVDSLATDEGKQKEEVPDSTLEAKVVGEGAESETATDDVPITTDSANRNDPKNATTDISKPVSGAIEGPVKQGLMDTGILEPKTEEKLAADGSIPIKGTNEDSKTDVNSVARDVNDPIMDLSGVSASEKQKDSECQNSTMQPGDGLLSKEMRLRKETLPEDTQSEKVASRGKEEPPDMLLPSNLVGTEESAFNARNGFLDDAASANDDTSSSIDRAKARGDNDEVDDAKTLLDTSNAQDTTVSIDTAQNQKRARTEAMVDISPLAPAIGSKRQRLDVDGDSMKDITPLIDESDCDSEVLRVDNVFDKYDEHKLDRAKSMLYSAGGVVHRGRGFERKFAEYWEAMTLRLSDTLSSHTSERCRVAFKAFLKTKKLRRLHNKFVMGLMERSTCRVAPLCQISKHIPAKWFSKMKLPHNWPQQERLRKVKKAGETDGRRGGFPMASDLYQKAWTPGTDPIDPGPYVSKEEETLPNEGDSPETASSRIPGALVVDPLVRKVVHEEGMRVSENAVWLLVVATKAHSQSILKKVVTMKEGLDKGQLVTPEIELPTASSPGKRRQSPQKKTSSVSAATAGVPKTKKLIRASDICTLSAAMPAGPTDALGGSLSRSAFERCLHSSYASNYASPGRDFLEVQRFIASEILACAARRAKLEREHPKHAATTALQTKPDVARADSSRQMQQNRTAPADSSRQMHQNQTAPADSSMQMQQSQTAPAGSSMQNQTAPAGSSNQMQHSQTAPPASASSSSSMPVIRGLGRGAKNLAALKARAASPPHSQGAATDGDRVDTSTTNSAPSQNPDDDTTRDKADVQPNDTSNGAGGDVDRESGGSPSNMQGRRGKGFGIKNLAAMRARTTKKD